MLPLTQRIIRKYICYGMCHKCGSMPGEPCWNVRSLPRSHDSLDKPHKGRLQLVRVPASLKIVARQCPSRHPRDGWRCSIGVHPDLGLHLNYDFGCLFQWYDTRTRLAGVTACPKQKGLTY